MDCERTGGDAALAELIRRRKNEIARRFGAVARRYGAAEALGDEDVIDNLDLFLDELCAAVEEGTTSPNGASSAAAALHGEQRFRIGYDLASVMREYAALREVLSEIIEESGASFSPRGVHAMFGFLVLGMADGASRYTALHDARLEKKTAEHIAFLAHELRNPLSSAAMALALMREKDELPPSRTVAALERGIARTLRLVDDSLVTVKLRELGKLERRSIDVREFLEDIAADSQFDADAKDIAFVASGEGRAVVDPKALRSAVSNLVRNAVKFTRPGGHVVVRGRCADSRFLVEVEDECGGIAEEQIAKLFDPFVQVGQDRSGFGLGLAIARQVAIAHDGQVRVHNLPQRGCVFVLDLPQEPAPSSSPPSSSRGT